MKTYRIVASTIFVSDKDGKKFLEKSFLLADVQSDIVLVILFRTMNNANIDFQARELQWRSYTIGNIVPTTIRVELIGKNKFATTALHSEHETSVVQVAVLKTDSGDDVHPSRRLI